VPVPVERHVQKRMPLAAGPAHSKPGLVTPETVSTAWGNYSYVSANAPLVAAEGISGRLTINMPHVSLDEGHSLAELAASSIDGKQVVEVGWIVNAGDTAPHLFVYHWVDGQNSCYDGCGYVQYSSTIYPGMALPSDGQPRAFEILHYGGKWWLYYGSEWFGYFPDSLWNNNYGHIYVGQWFGEVAAPSTSPCSQMGNGLYGAESGSASITNMRFFYSPSFYLSPPLVTYYVSDPGSYDDGSTSNTSFSYGGPGSGGKRCL
jgi:hypothetical protein